MAVAYDFILVPEIERPTQEPEGTQKQRGAVAFVKATVSGAAGETVNCNRFGISQLRGVLQGLVNAAAIAAYNESANTVTIPNSNGVYTFMVFGQRAGARENYDAGLLK